jgi:predicted enzyme related to lactoylglutathione lyase
VDYRIDCMNLAAADLDAMVTFYAGVFGIDFRVQELQGAKLYAGSFAGSGFVLLRIGEDDTMRCIGVFDPDDNFMVFRQMKAAPDA